MAGSIGLQTSGAGAIRRLVAGAPPLTRLFHLLMYATSASAQPQLDNDYYDDDDENKQKESEAVPVLDTEGLVPTRGVQWTFIGNPCAKKHVYAEKISKLLEVPRISVASLVRQDLSPSSSIYKQIANAVNQGKLVPEEIMFGLLSKRLEDGYYKGETGFILDGIPQTLIQAEILEKLVDIDLVVNFKCPKDCLLQHHGDSIYSHSRQSDRFSGFGYGSLNLVSPGAQTKYSFCNEKAHIYHKQMKPVEDYYKKQNKLIDFQVGSAPGETWRGLLAALHLQHINAANCRLTSGSTGL